MDHLPATWTALCMLAFALGARHGVDADHLATIDGLTRHNVRINPRLARLVGALFSLGHGLVVMLVATLAQTLAAVWATPEWLQLTGVVISVVFLFGLAFLNIRAVLRADPGHVVAPVGLKGRLLGRFLTARRGWAVVAVGMLFALSFDTISQAALFALAAGRFGGLGDVLFIAGLFVAGMLCVDGLNGLWISRLVRRADRTAAIASRIMALAVAGISLAVGMLTVLKVLAPAVDAWSEHHELLLGGMVVASVLVAFALALTAARRRQVMAGAPVQV
ncbi:MAG: nickel transporter [Casimicrobiaceae bacterium]